MAIQLQYLRVQAGCAAVVGEASPSTPCGAVNNSIITHMKQVAVTTLQEGTRLEVLVHEGCKTSSRLDSSAVSHGQLLQQQTIAACCDW